MRNAGTRGGQDLKHRSSSLKVAFASLIGSVVEWYDFFLYGTAAAIVFNKLYFPELDDTAATLAAFATFAVGFFARPLGAILFGHFGDRIGRKSMLVTTIVLMGAATFAVGLVPTYAAIGVWAPILLTTLRLLQGLAVGGEWGGAAIMAVEHAPKDRRGFFGSWPQVGVPVGLLLSTLSFSLVNQLPEDDFYAWGWRLLFLLSIVLVFIGLIIRLKIAESPIFAEVAEAKQAARIPIAELARFHKKNIALGLGSRLVLDATFYLFATFALAYGTTQLGLDRSMILAGIMAAAALEIFTIPMLAGLSDRVGRRPVYLSGALLLTVWPTAFFILLDTRQTLLVWFAMIVGLAVGHAATYGPQASLIAELFPSRVRYSGMSITYHMSGIFGGGPAPMIATALFALVGGHWWPIAVYAAFLGVIGVVCTYLLKETAKSDLVESVDAEPAVVTATPV